MLDFSLESYSFSLFVYPHTHAVGVGVYPKRRCVMYGMEKEPRYVRLRAAEAILAGLVERERVLKQELAGAQACIERAAKIPEEIAKLGTDPSTDDKEQIAKLQAELRNIDVLAAERKIADLETPLAAAAFEVKLARETAKRIETMLGNRCRRESCRGTRRAPRKSGSDRKRSRGNSPFCGPCSGVRGRISTKTLHELTANAELNIKIAQ